MRITRRQLRQIIKEELSSIREIRRSAVGGDYRDAIGGMSIAKYPGPWASGDEMNVLEDDIYEEDTDLDEQDSVEGFMAPLGRGSSKEREKRRMSTARAIAGAFGGGTVT